MVPLMVHILVDEAQVGVRLWHLHLKKVFLVQELELAKGFLEVVNTAIELCGDSDVFKAEVGIEGVLGLVCL